MREIEKLASSARVYLIAAAAGRVLLAAAPVVGVIALAASGMSISIEGGAA